MEERLFFIGLGMGGYAWVSRRFERDKTLDTPLKAAFWHAFFRAMAGFSLTLVLMMSIQTRTRSSIVAGSLTTSELYPSLVVAAFAAIAGFWKSYRTAKRPGKKGYYLAEDAEWSETVFSAVMLAAVLMYFVIQAFKIPSGSMERTLLIGDHLFVNKFIYGFRVPLTGKRVLPLSKVDRGDIVVFQFPVDDPSEVHCGDLQYKKDFIKRVVGLPGETVQVVGGRVLINGKELAPEPYAQYTAMDRQAPSVKTLGLSAMQYQDLWQSHQLDKELQDIQKDYFGPVIVPEGGYFVMGDNRDHSCDSRYWGPVESKYLKGKAWIIYWPPSRMGLVR